MRKNIHIPDDLARRIGDIRHDGRFSTETSAIIELLEGAVSYAQQKRGYVYLARNEKNGELKIGFSINPRQRMVALRSEVGSDVALMHVLIADQLMETVAHVVWGRFRLHGEWFSDQEEIISWFRGHDLLADIPTIEKPAMRHAVIGLSDEQYELLRKAAAKVGLEVPAYIRVRALEAANADAN
jgi:hypothetical protein